ncbi:MAG: metallo-beta-lactamase family protein [Parcubacteria group bacterium Gr01-1014_20]|nr:MAG: metallo-beta-lactamase family protein [Parcubacteria group bacterium Gr01-1014_20]
MKIIFYGGANSVTGSNYYLENAETRVLVDCGLHQGSNFAERRNFEPLPYDAKKIDAVFITHSHIDHIGLLPKLLRDGFRGKIYSTKPTKDFAELMLLDSEHILGEEAKKWKKPALYGAEDVSKVMAVWVGVEYHAPVEVGDLSAEFFDAGHILGSAFIRISGSGKSVVFSGDLGNYPAPIIKSTEKIPEADYCLIESTYGDRVHEGAESRLEQLEDAIEDINRSKGVLLIPAFAMERTQQLLYELNELVENGRVPKIPVYIDSPLAIKLTSVYKKYRNYFNEEAAGLIRGGDDILDFKGLHLTLTTDQSKEINNVHPPKVVVAGSGMSHGGRILHHERRYLPDPNSMVLFIGYQGSGSLGRMILDGAREVKIMGESIPVRARVRRISAYSAHADQPRLLEWLKPARQVLKNVFVVQGESGSSEALAQKINDELAIQTTIPSQGQECEL